jgi:hypothetical protein
MGVTFLIGSHYIELSTALARHTTLPVRTTAAGLQVSLGDIECTKATKTLRAIAERHSVLSNAAST